MTAELDAEYAAIIAAGQASLDRTRPAPGTTNQADRRHER